MNLVLEFIIELDKMSAQSYPVPGIASLFDHKLPSTFQVFSTFIMSDCFHNQQDSSLWWERDSVSWEIILVIEGHERWTKSRDDVGNDGWAEVPHADDGWESGGHDDWSNEEISNNGVADVHAPGWFATDGVSSSLVSTSWWFGVGVVVVHFMFFN